VEQETIVKGYDADIMRRIFAFSRPYRWIVFAAIFAMLVSTAAELALPVLLKDIMDRYILTVSAESSAGIARGAVSFLSLLVVILVFSFLETLLMTLAGQRIMKDLRMHLYHHIIHQELSFLGSQPAGRLVTRITNDVETVNELFTSVLTSLLKDLFIMAGVVIALVSLDPKLALITLLSLPPVLGFTLYYRVKARDAFRQVRLWVSRVNSFLSEHLSGMKIIQIFVQEESVRRSFGTENEAMMKAQLGEMYVYATFRPIIDFCASISLGTILYFGAAERIRGAITLGTLVAFVTLIRKFFQPVMDISEKYTILQSALAGGERIFQLLENDRRIPDLGAETIPPHVKGKIEFRDVEFSYKKGEPVIRNLSFTVNPGETAALVGYTGSGKTTIANLLTRLWDVENGAILLDDVDIRSLPLKTLRQTIQPIQQEVFLFSQTIRENICLGLDITEDKLVLAAKSAQAHGFISGLAKGYDTVLQEGAANISAGQKQLLAFSRILAHDPPVIILDEATANIDTETEKLIQEALATILRGRTALVIAHRLSTIKHADKIMVLSQGTIVEEGTHDELMRRKGTYCNLYRFQYETDGA